MTTRHQKWENMKRILHRNYYNNDTCYNFGYLNLEDLVAVRAVKNNNSNLVGEKMYPSPVRATIHFSLNHLVNSHWYGSWENCNEAHIVPFKDLIENNKENFIGGSTVDIYFAGPIIIPKSHSVVKRKENEEYEKFEERVENEIENKGYLVVPGGGWDWADQNGSWELKKLFKTLGPYKGEAHSASVFGYTDEAVHYTLLDYLEYKKSKSDPAIKKLLKNLFKNPDLIEKAHIDNREIEVRLNGTNIRKIWKIFFKKFCETEHNRISALPSSSELGYEPDYFMKLYERVEPYLDDWIYNHPTVKNKLK
ncbi:MAG: hypothetical protein N3G19_01525 [Candidatus Pacearchaeota archaeon]|nr:hypothetical protein [Candidatus Pacearchaeota archaeon]